MTTNLTDTVTHLLEAVLACLPPARWHAALLDLELRDMQDGFDTDYVGIVLVPGPGGALTQDQFQLDHDARQAAMALYHERKTNAAEDNAGFTLRLDRSGDYRLTFKHQVKRLAGIWDQAEEDYIDQYLQHYMQQTATGPTS